MRLIDADELKKAIKEQQDLYIVTLSYHNLNNIIDNAPAIPNEYMRGYEVAEREYKRPQGEWINTSPYDDKGECSLCCYLSKKYYKFCPYCGSAMRGDKE